MAQLRVLRRWLGLGLAAALTPVGLAGQTAAPGAPPTRQTVVAGAHYRAGWLHRLFLGAHYRDLWGTPVEVQVLDLSRFAGGLTPTGCGGRRQTKVLRLLGKDGRQYVFRSIDKDPTLALPPELRATFARDVVQDQISSAHPGGPLVVAPLLDATGVLHAEPRMMLLPADDPRLRGYDCVRPGFLLGMIEERPTEPPDNDVAFGDDYPSIWRLTLAGEVPDRRLLQDLEKPVWDSVARTLQARLTDSVIDGAVRRLPPEYLRRNGAALTRALRRRRDHLPQISDRYYALLAQVVEIHGTDERDLAEVERLAGRRVSVRLAPGSGGPPFYRRTFDGRETQEIRLFLHGGDDRLIVRGTGGSGPLLRVIGGGGDDELTDSSRVGGTQFYDDRGNDRFVTGPGTSVDRRHYDEPPRDTSTFSLPRDWGSRWMPLTWVSYSPDLGVFAGAGADGTGYDFRRLPYNSHVRVRAGYATAAQTYRAEFTGEFRGVVPPVIVRLRLRASGIDVLRFYGLGNETRDTGASNFYKVKQQQYLVAPALQFLLSPSADLSVGPVLKFTHTSQLNVGSPYGVGDVGQVGAAADLQVDTRDRPRAARRGITFGLGGSYYPRALDLTSPFGEGHAEASSYLTARIPLRPTLAVRVAGRKVWGTYPYYEAAYIGGDSTVRGFVAHRFAGDAAVFGNVELRLSLARFFVLVPGQLGILGLGDAGRVYVSGETSDRWHAAAGGGLWLSFLSSANTVSVAAAHSVEGTRWYAKAGFAF